MPVLIKLELRFIFFGILIALIGSMIKWIIATYIIVVLGFSATAKAFTTESNPALNIFTHPAKVTTELEVQDPLPESTLKSSRPMNISNNKENSVG